MMILTDAPPKLVPEPTATPKLDEIMRIQEGVKMDNFQSKVLTKGKKMEVGKFSSNHIWYT